MTRLVPVHASGPQHIESLAARLTTMTLPEAQMRRLAFDAHFERWLSRTLDLQTLSIAGRPISLPWVLSFDTDHGGFEVAVDLADHPALQMALALPDSVLACAVATHLMAPLTKALEPALGSVSITARRRNAGVVGTISLSAGDWRCGLLRCDAALVDRLLALAEQSAGADISPFASLAMRARIRLMVRHWTREVIASLQVGDVVLAGTRGHTLIGGVGCTLQAPVYINPQEFKLQVAEAPHISSSDETPAAHNSGGSMENLQLPVAFELDTARISLAELSTMRPGYAIELDVPLLEATVRLVCHGQTLGHGQLVAIGDQLGVRITRMEYTHDTGIPG